MKTTLTHIKLMVYTVWNIIKKQKLTSAGQDKNWESRNTCEESARSLHSRKSKPSLTLQEKLKKCLSDTSGCASFQ